MAITVETFRADHFEALVRGVGVACESYKKLQAELLDSDDRLLAQTVRVEEMEEELLELGNAQERLDRLIEYIEDVHRGVRTLEELRAHARSEAQC